MTIKEVERLTGMIRENIRFYEKEGLLSPARDANGYREYSWEDVERLKLIKLLRVLHLPLDEVKSLISGEKNLDETLRNHMQTLETQIAQYKASLEVCKTICRDTDVLEKLDSDRYYAMVEGKEDSNELKLDVIDKEIAPVARTVARALDMTIYGMILVVVLTLVFKVRTMNPFVGTVLPVAAQLVLTLLIEPLLISKFGWTIGKLTMGMRILHKDGRKLTYGEALKRTVGILNYGLGFGIFPYNAYRLAKNYEFLEKERPLPWENCSYVVADTRPRKLIHGIAYVGTFVAVILMALGAVQFSELSPNRGDLTIEQFAENFNHHAELHGGHFGMEINKEGKRILSDDAERYNVTEAALAEMPVFVYEMEGNYLTSVSWEKKYENITGYIKTFRKDMELAVRAFAGQDGGLGILPDEVEDAVYTIKTYSGRSFHTEANGVEIDCIVNYTGLQQHETNGGIFLTPADYGDNTYNSYTITFTMKKLD